MDFKRALVRPQKGTFYKPISRLLGAKRPRIDFELYENSLQIPKQKGNKLFTENRYTWYQFVFYPAVYPPL